MPTTSIPSSIQMTIDIHDRSIVKELQHLLKRMQGISNVRVKTNYYESQEFYQDIKNAEEDIARGKGLVVKSSADLDKLFV